MIFNSLPFFVFFPTVVAAFFLTPARLRWVVLLGASWLFYGWWKPQFLLVLLTSTTVGYLVGRALAREENERRRHAWLLLSLGANLGVLFFFKYLNVHVPLTRGIFGATMPVGISFFTFQTIGYTVDVYRRQYEPEHHYGRFALFLSFFPHLVAGPIMRGHRLLPQFRMTQRWDYDRVVSALGLILWGLFKKVVIADRAAAFVDPVFRAPEHFKGLTILVTTYIFAFQLYGDFSGYSDIAVGTARVLGFELMDNFDRPFASRSLVAFWRRWHISFSTWFNDYVYAPLGIALGRIDSPLLEGKRGRAIRTTITVVIVCLLSGLWHGGKWTFLAWGLFMASAMLLTIAVGTLWKRGKVKVSPPFQALGHVLGVALTFHLVCVSLVLFRARDLGQARAIFTQLAVGAPTSVWWELSSVGPGPQAMDLGILAASVALMEGVQWAVAHGLAQRTPYPLRFVGWAALCAWVMLTAVQSHTPFIYFSF